MKRMGVQRIWEGIPLRGGLGRRILLWFLVLSLIPLLVSNTVGYLVTREIIEGQMRRYLTGLTEVEAEHVAHEVERHHLYLDALIAGNALLTRTVPTAAAAVAAGAREAPAVIELHEHLDRKLAQLEPLTELTVLDSEGRVIASTNHDRLGALWTNGELVRQARRGWYFGEDREHGHGRAHPIYRLAAPIRDDAGGELGMLVGTVGFERAQAFLRIPSHIAGDVHVYIVDAQGRPLFISHQHEPIDYAEPLPSPLAAESGNAFARYVNYEGVEVLGTSTPVPGLPWRYVSEVSVASAFGQLRELALLAGVLEAAFALLLVAIVWLVARSITAPLRRLVGAAERIRAGDLGVEVRIDRHDELGELGRTFNQMSTELRDSAKQIQELHDQEMRRAAQLASVGELASGIAHEVKNPLVGAVSGLDLLANRMGHDADAERILGQVRTQLTRIDAALRDLLSYARPKEPRLAWTDPARLVDRVIDLVRPQAEAAGIRLDHRVEAEVPRLRLDPEQMTEALVNLVLNGIQAMEPGGVLELAVDSDAEEVRIGVSDTGPGIPEERIESIFRPFFTTKSRGTGLGLAITRGIVERHGGRLEVDTRPGEGSTFTLVLPSNVEVMV